MCSLIFLDKLRLGDDVSNAFDVIEASDCNLELVLSYLDRRGAYADRETLNKTFYFTRQFCYVGVMVVGSIACKFSFSGWELVNVIFSL